MEHAHVDDWLCWLHLARTIDSEGHANCISLQRDLSSLAAGPHSCRPSLVISPKDRFVIAGLSPEERSFDGRWV